MNIQELKQIQLSRQHLTNKTDRISIVNDLCGVQCQFMVNAFHSLRIRCKDELISDEWSSGLVKNWTLRSTLHVFAQEDLPLFIYLDEDGGNYYLNNEWTDEMCENRLWISGTRKRFFAEYIINCVRNGIDTREMLKEKCREVGMTHGEELFIFNAWGGLFSPLCKRGFLTHKVQEKKAFTICPPFKPMEKKTALKKQMRRYLENIAPATIRDAAYFFRYSQKQVKDILSELPVEKFNMNRKEYFYMGKLKSNYPDIPKCIFLSGFDQLMLGYQKADSIYLQQEYIRNIFNLAGIVLPCILLNGNVVGKWKKINKKLEVTCFKNITQIEKTAIINQAEETWCNDVKAIIFN